VLYYCRVGPQGRGGASPLGGATWPSAQHWVPSSAVHLFENSARRCPVLVSGEVAGREKRAGQGEARAWLRHARRWRRPHRPRQLRRGRGRRRQGQRRCSACGKRAATTRWQAGAAHLRRVASAAVASTPACGEHGSSGLDFCSEGGWRARPWWCRGSGERVSEAGQGASGCAWRAPRLPAQRRLRQDSTSSTCSASASSSLPTASLPASFYRCGKAVRPRIFPGSHGYVSTEIPDRIGMTPETTTEEVGCHGNISGHVSRARGVRRLSTVRRWTSKRQDDRSTVSLLTSS
jgi:hypothetical protein